jgi:hypothetical protein
MDVGEATEDREVDRVAIPPMTRDGSPVQAV